MLEFIRQYQLDIMLVMSGVCATIAIFALMSRTASPQRRGSLFLLESSATLLLVADRFVYLFNGDVSTLGFWMMRVCNLIVYFSVYTITYAFTLYLEDVCVREDWDESAPRWFQTTTILLAIGVAMLVFSQFTGLYYTFDSQNHYQRSPGYLVCYLIPAAVYAILIVVILKNFKNMSALIRFSLLLFMVGPIVAAGIQAFTPWISINNMSLAFFGIFLYSFDLVDLNRQVERAHQLEIEMTHAREQEARTLFEQTASALASAIDEKDAYTRGHSARVAAYARLIAERAGKDEEICEQVYYAGLLHDVGKIGIPSAIINKDGKLTDEENELIRTHPARGDHILASIEQSPYLRIGARYHHERYDGKGYPDGLADEEIPDIARIIAVADTYDAMASKRSYRDAMPQDVVRAEMEAGIGTQFDPAYARIMVELIDEDENYDMRERNAANDGKR